MLDAGTIHHGEAAALLHLVPENSVDLIVTSPPYWTAVAYDGLDNGKWLRYEDYLEDIFEVWHECHRVLRPNGKLCINTPLMPIPQDVICQDTRHIKDIAGDFAQMIVGRTPMRRFSVYVWQKQTSKMMFGSYPYPGNILENNTVEFINVYVKPGKPPKFDPAVKEFNRLSREEWLDLTQQIWYIYPENVKRDKGHPAPFPRLVPARLIRLYTYGACDGFAGEIVLDPFAGTGTTCVVAQAMKRRWIGIDVVENYVTMAMDRLQREATFSFDSSVIIGRPGAIIKPEMAGSSGVMAERKHKRRSYG